MTGYYYHMKENENKYNYKRTDFNLKKIEHISNL